MFFAWSSSSTYRRARLRTHSFPSETNALKQRQRTWLRERKPSLNRLRNIWCPVGAVSQVPEHQTYSASLRRDNRDLRDRTAQPRRACRIARWPRDRSVRVERRHLQAPMQSRMRRLPAATDRLDVDRRQSSIVFHPTIRDAQRRLRAHTIRNPTENAFP